MNITRVLGVALHTPEDNPADGPVLLFVHGGSHGAWCFHSLMENLARRGQACAGLDWYNHGLSRQREDFLTRNLEDVAGDEIATAVDYLAPRPVVLVGHSMGGLAAMLAAGALRRRVVGLGLLAPAVPASVPGSLPRWVPWKEGKVYNVPRWPVPVVRRMFFPEVGQAEARALRNRLTAESGTVIRQTVLRTLDVDYDALRGLPTTVVVGDKDRLVNPGQVTALCSELGGTLCPLGPVGHGLWTRPVWPEVADSLLRLAERVDA